MIPRNIIHRIIFNKPARIILILMMAVMAAGTVSVQAADNKKPKTCDNVKLSGKLKAPKDKTKATRQVVTLNEDCSVNEGPVEEIPASEVPLPADPSLVLPSVDEGFQATEGAIRSMGTFSRQIVNSSEIKDPVGILLTALYTNARWDGDFTRITGYSVGASVSRHRETGPLGDVGGWNYVRGTNGGGCALPCARADFSQHAEFSYRGGFDPTGTLYYNTHDNTEALFGDSRFECSYAISARKWFPGWTWTKTCR